MDYTGEVPGNDSPRKSTCSSVSSQMPEMRERKRLDNWQQMLERYATKIFVKPEGISMEEQAFLARTKFGKRILLMDGHKAYAISPPEEGDESDEESEGSGLETAKREEALSSETRLRGCSAR